MAAYLIGTAYDVNDPAGFDEYRSKVMPTLEKYGAKVIIASESVEVADGDWSPIGAVVIEFDSMERAKEWYNSPEYAAVKPLRLKAAKTGVIFVQPASM